MWRWIAVCAATSVVGAVSYSYAHDPVIEPLSPDVMNDPSLDLASGSTNIPAAESCCAWHWTDSLELFAGLDGSKQPQDFGVNAHFGGRIHANWAMPLWQEQGLGLQIGTAITQSDHAVAVTHAIEGSSSRTQSFTTLGIFQRTESGWTWAIANDILFQDDYNRQTLDQWRARIGYDLNGRDEVGVMGSLPQNHANADWAGAGIRLEPLRQGSVFWRHSWEFGGQTTTWLGVADRHGQANIALGDRPDTNHVIVFGADLQVPLNNYWALFGEANFVTPADTGTVDAYLGFAYYPAGGAVGWRRRAWSPVLPVASSPSFVTNLTR